MAETIISPGVLTRENDISFIQPAPLAVSTAIVGPTVKGPVMNPTVVTSYGDYLNKFGSTFTSGSTKQEFFTSMTVRSFFEQGGTSALITRVASGSFTPAESTEITAIDETGPSFTLETLGEGTIMNSTGSEGADGSLVNGTVDNIRWEVLSVNTGSGLFNLIIRRGDDTTRNKIILETWNNVSLDPAADTYIARVIGDQYQEYDVVENYVSTTGEYPNRSRYVRVGSVDKPTLNYLANDGISVRDVDFKDYLPLVGSGSFTGATGEVTGNGSNSYFTDVSTNTQGLVKENYTDAINLLGNQDEYLFNVITTPGLTYADHTSTINQLISMVESRGDAIAVIDLDGYGTAVNTVASQAQALNTSYGAAYWPWVQMRSETGKNVYVPASVVIPGVYAFTDRSTAPWFAPAGLVRGGIPGVLQVERKLSKSNREALYSGKVNGIATFPGTGIAVFGQKTLQTKASALDRVNVRRLLISLKKFLGDQARNLVFEQNTISTRSRFLRSEEHTSELQSR